MQHNAYTVGWISAIAVEVAAATALLDEKHETLPGLPGDTNTYSCGRIGEHNVVIVGLPAGTYGTASSAVVAMNLLQSFPNIRFGLMVGIGGGVPFPNDIRLGDVVVGLPQSSNGGVIQYDFGKVMQDGTFATTGHLNKPPRILTSAVTTLRARQNLTGYKFPTYIRQMLEDYPLMKRAYDRPARDDLYAVECNHVDSLGDCHDCPGPGLLQRPHRPSHDPFVFYGLIGSGNAVMKNAKIRDELHEKHGIICFEMEAAGLMDSFPCLVIRGICDYADSHKNKEWQPYAAATAAAYAKELLSFIAPLSTRELVQRSVALEQDVNFAHAEQEKNEKCLQDIRLIDPRTDKTRNMDTIDSGWDVIQDWLERDSKFREWKDGSESSLLWITGSETNDRMMLFCEMIEFAEQDELGGTPAAYVFLPAADSRQNTATAVLRALIFMMIKQHSSLVKYVRIEYDVAGRQLFEDANAWYALSSIFDRMLRDPVIGGTMFMVLSLDHCATNSDELLQLIVNSAYTTRVKWVVTSAEWPRLEQYLRLFNRGSKLSIEWAAGPNETQLWYTFATISEASVRPVKRMRRQYARVSRAYS